MIGIYFSGTGNTKHCVEKLVKLLDASAQSFPLEHTEMIQILEEHDIIVLGYPTQFSNAPIIVRDFIKNHSSLWNGKKVFCVNTMGLFSGDGTGCTARILRKYGATILGGLQIKMPDSVCDSKLLKKTLAQNREIVRQADQKIEAAARQIRLGSYPQEGLSFLSHLKGHMSRTPDKLHMIYFVRDGVRIGASQYCTFKSEDGKCFILDFWVFPAYRGNGTGHECFHALSEYTRRDGALYYALNYAKEDSRRFWLSLGFVDNGMDECGTSLMIKKDS